MAMMKQKRNHIRLSATIRPMLGWGIGTAAFAAIGILLFITKGLENEETPYPYIIKESYIDKPQDKPSPKETGQKITQLQRALSDLSYQKNLSKEQIATKKTYRGLLNIYRKLEDLELKMELRSQGFPSRKAELERHIHTLKNEIGRKEKDLQLYQRNGRD